MITVCLIKDIGPLLAKATLTVAYTYTPEIFRSLQLKSLQLRAGLTTTKPDYNNDRLDTGFPFIQQH